MSEPPPVSVRPATIASGGAGRNPTWSKNRAVPAGPPPFHHPKSFCVPCPMNRVPMTSRRISKPISTSVTSQNVYPVWTLPASPRIQSCRTSRSSIGRFGAS